VLEADRRLADAIPQPARDAAAIYMLAHTHWLEPGEWHPPYVGTDPAGHLGLLILDGFLVRHVTVIDRPPAELLGPGDLLHPWEPDHTEPFVAGVRWEVIAPARVAVLDRRFAAVIGRWPEVVAALFARAIARSRSLLLNLAISQLVGVDIRLLVMLWHIAERWGVKGEGHAGDGCVVPVHLTHALLATLISAQRPTVTTALADLGERGLLSRGDDGLLVLHGEPPREFRRLRSALP
jgi:CRP/FNR family cyclic AMP-dependent transcriptional regulator